MSDRYDAFREVAANFVGLVGTRPWVDRIACLGRECGAGQRTHRAVLTRYGIEVTLEKFRRGTWTQPPTAMDETVSQLATEIVGASIALAAAGRVRLREKLKASLAGDATLAPLFHIARTAAMQRSRGFTVEYVGFAHGAACDLLVSRGGSEAEIACETISAEDGRDLHRGAWVRLVDRVDPDLQTWLAAHPGRYLLKLTLPRGLRRGTCTDDPLAALHGRIRTMLEGQRRADYDEAAVLRLDPLMLAGAQADELGLMNRLRREFGHEAHLAVTASRGSVFVMAARAGREDEVAVAMRRRLAAVAPTRLTGERPGILAVLIDDTDRIEWRHLCDDLVLEGEARQLLTLPEARAVVAVTCASRLEMLGDDGPGTLSDGELRFRNPAHPGAKLPGLAPAVVSSF